MDITVLSFFRDLKEKQVGQAAGSEGGWREGIEGVAHQPPQGGSGGDAAAGGETRAPARGPAEARRPGAQSKRRTLKTLAPLPSRIHPAPPLPNTPSHPALAPIDYSRTQVLFPRAGARVWARALLSDCSLVYAPFEPGQ